MGYMTKYLVMKSMKTKWGTVGVNAIYHVTHSSLYVGKVAAGTVKAGIILAGAAAIKSIDDARSHTSQSVTDILNYTTKAAHEINFDDLF